jgi:hypothetical protein
LETETQYGLHAVCEFCMETDLLIHDIATRGSTVCQDYRAQEAPNTVTFAMQLCNYKNPWRYRL